LFERSMRGQAAILSCAGERGRAVLFSPHPEMGDLVRKYLVLDAYARRYLPIRGEAVIRDTLRHYAPLESPCFRLVLNPVHASPSARAARPLPEPGASREQGGSGLCGAIGDALAGLSAPGEIEAMIAADLRQRLASLVDPSSMPRRLARDAVEFLTRPGGTIERLCAIELAISLVAA